MNFPDANFSKKAIITLVHRYAQHYDFVNIFQIDQLKTQRRGRKIDSDLLVKSFTIEQAPSLPVCVSTWFKIQISCKAFP